MNKQEFLERLRARLSSLPSFEVEKTLSYFAEIIDDRMEDGMSEYEAVASLESLERIVETILPDREGGERGRNLESASRTMDANSIHSIYILDKNCPIIIKRSRNNEVAVDYYESRMKSYILSQDNGVLEVRAEYTGKFFHRLTGFDFAVYSRPFVLELPENYTGRVYIETSNATVTASDISIIGSLSISSSNGRLEARSASVSEELIMRSSNNRVTVDGVRAGQVTAKTSNGRIELINVRSDTRLSAETGNGAINVENIFAGRSINLVSSNGRIHGTIEDNMRVFSISSRTSNGQNSLPGNMPGGEKDLHVRTSNGRIDILFTR